MADEPQSTTQETPESTEQTETVESEATEAQSAEAKRLEELENENNRLKRAAAENSKKAREAEKAAKAAAEQKAKEEGNWQKVAEEKEREAQEAAERAKEAEERLTAFERQGRVAGIATRLKFRDPSDASLFLSEDEQDDDRKAEAALKRVAREKPYLVDEQRRSGAAIEGGQNGLTPEQEHKETLKQLLGRPG